MTTLTIAVPDVHLAVELVIIFDTHVAQASLLHNLLQIMCVVYVLACLCGHVKRLPILVDALDYLSFEKACKVDISFNRGCLQRFRALAQELFWNSAVNDDFATQEATLELVYLLPGDLADFGQHCLRHLATGAKIPSQQDASI